MSETYEFEVEMRVRRRMHLAGPKDREIARAILKQALEGGMNPSSFSMYGDDRKPIEQIVGNEIVVHDFIQDSGDF